VSNEFCMLDPLVRADVPDAVHRMRVAGRRLRAVLQTYRPLFDRGTTDPLRREVGWVVHQLGTARDLEVLQATLARQHAAGGGDGGAELAERHRAAHRAAIRSFRSNRYRAVRDEVAELGQHPPFTPRGLRPAGKELSRALRHRVSRLETAVLAVDRATTVGERAARLHSVRKVARSLRYAVEAAEPVFGRPAAEYAAALARVQDELGEQHDLLLARQVLEVAVEEDPPQDPMAGVRAVLRKKATRWLSR